MFLFPLEQKYLPYKQHFEAPVRIMVSSSQMVFFMHDTTDEYYVECCLNLVLIKYIFYSAFAIESLKSSH